VEQHFSIYTMVSQIEALYHELAAPAPEQAA
jgi:hypothetical protein